MTRSLVRTIGIAAFAPLLMTACDDDGAGPDRLQPGDVAGVYAVCTLTFVPEGGTLPSVSLRDAAFETTNPNVQQPQLRVDPTRVIELIYTPKGGFVSQNVRGTFGISGQRVDLRFVSGTVLPRSLLLPEVLSVNFQASPRTLLIAQSDVFAVARADYARLSGQSETNLAPEIRGRLSATFRDVQAGGCA